MIKTCSFCNLTIDTGLYDTSLPAGWISLGKLHDETSCPSCQDNVVQCAEWDCKEKRTVKELNNNGWGEWGGIFRCKEHYEQFMDRIGDE